MDIEPDRLNLQVEPHFRRLIFPHCEAHRTEGGHCDTTDQALSGQKRTRGAAAAIMITWQGLGFLVALTWLPPLMVVWGYTDRAFLWPSVLGHIVSISITYLVGRKLNGNGTRHYFCEIPFEYSGFVLSGICAVVYVFFLFLSGRPPL